MHGVSNGIRRILTLLDEARFALRMETFGPLSAPVAHGQVFDYFDNAEFVSRYLNHVSNGVTIRLLTHKKLGTLLPAVDLFAAQSKLTIQVRSAPNLHDRYVFVDCNACYQSGASFKDGAKSAPTMLTQITDAFPAMMQTYEAIWSSANIER